MMKKVFKVIIGTFAWLPVLYSLVFLIISIVTGTIGENWGFYFVGLSVSLIACVALTYLYARRAKPEAPAEEPGDAQPAAPRKFWRKSAATAMRSGPLPVSGCPRRWN